MQNEMLHLIPNTILLQKQKQNRNLTNSALPKVTGRNRKVNEGVRPNSFSNNVHSVKKNSISIFGYVDYVCFLAVRKIA